jgi:hypothetical protein
MTKDAEIGMVVWNRYAETPWKVVGILDGIFLKAMYGAYELLEVTSDAFANNYVANIEKVEKAKPQSLTLFVYEDVLRDYTAGMAVVAAESRAEAVQFMVDKYGESVRADFENTEPIMLLLADGYSSKKGVIASVTGGG